MRKLQPDEITRMRAAISANAERHPLYVIVDNVRSAFNVGSVLRTADAVRATHVYLAGYTPDGAHSGVHKAALGAQDLVPWTRFPTVSGAIDAARGAGCIVAALEITDAPTPVDSLRRNDFPLCLVIGNEVDGVSDEALARSDMAIELPQFGAKHSLNVAVAFGVVAYDVVRQFRGLTGRSPGPPGEIEIRPS